MPSRKEEDTEKNQITRQNNDFDHLIKLYGPLKDDEATNAINKFFYFFYYLSKYRITSETK
jgi:hypothetical protein